MISQKASRSLASRVGMGEWLSRQTNNDTYHRHKSCMHVAANSKTKQSKVIEVIFSYPNLKSIIRGILASEF